MAPAAERPRLLGDAAWVVAGQLLTALGVLVGLRLLTGAMSPHTFGEITLLIGVAALASNVACSPLCQALLHLFPEVQQRGQVLALRRALLQALRAVLPWLSAALTALAALYWGVMDGSPVTSLLLVLLLACDIARAIQTNLLNAARRHPRYVLWMVAEAWLRPLAAVAALQVAGDSADAVLVAYISVSAVLLLILSPRPPAGTPATEPIAGLRARILGYARPLFPLGVVDWTNGVADRYLIGGLLTIADAGLYAASYGLASRPFQLLGQSLVLVLRPPLQAAVSAGHTAQALTLLRRWLISAAALVALGVLLVTLLRQPLADLLLGPEFRAGAELMPWIALGYGVLTVAQPFQYVCYAFGHTRAGLMIQSGAAVAGLISASVGASLMGLQGAAMAVPVCFAVQLLLSVIAARWSWRQAARSREFAMNAVPD